MSAGIQLWSGPRWGFASELLAFCGGIETDTLTERLDQTHRLSLVVDPDAEWLEHVAIGRSLWVPDYLPHDPEWRIAGRSMSMDGAVVIDLDHISAIMVDCGPVVFPRHRSEVSALHGINLNALNFLSTFIVPHLRRRGVEWIDVGVVESLAQFDLSWEGISARALLDEVAVSAGLEWRLRPAEFGYEIDMLERIGGAQEEVWATESVDLVGLSRDQPRDDLATVLRPFGDPSQGDDPSRATIEQASWRVAGVSGNVLTLAAHRGGRGPILEEDQFAGPITGVAPHGYALHWGAGMSPIVASSAPGTVEVMDATGASEGDDAMFVRLDENGGPLAVTELASPSGISASGVVVAGLDHHFRGGRNYLPNPLLRSWGVGGAGEVLVGRTQVGPSNVVTDLPPDITIPAGMVVLYTNGNGPAPTLRQQLSAPVTVNSSGEATMPFQVSVGGASQRPPVYFLPDSPTPARWTQQGVVTSIRRQGPGLLSENAEMAIDVTFQTTPYQPRILSLQGLIPGDTIQPGDLIRHGAVPARMMVAVGPVTVTPDSIPPPPPPPPPVLSDAITILRASQYTGSGPWLDESGNGNDATIDFTSMTFGTTPEGASFQGGNSPVPRISISIAPPHATAPEYTVVVVAQHPGGGGPLAVAGGSITADPGSASTVSLSFHAAFTRSTFWVSPSSTTTLPVQGPSFPGVSWSSEAVRRWALIMGGSGNLWDIEVEGVRLSGAPPALAPSIATVGIPAMNARIFGVAVSPRALDSSEIEEVADYLRTGAPQGGVSVPVADVTVGGAWISGDPVEIVRPPVAWRGESAIACFGVNAGLSAAEEWRTEEISPPLIREGQTIRARAVWALGGWIGGPWTISSSATVGSGVVRAPVVRIRRTDTNTIVATSTFTEVTGQPNAVWPEYTIECSYVVEDPSAPLRVEVLQPYGGGNWSWVSFFLGASLDYGAGDMPIIEGGEATAAWQNATERLRVTRAWRSTMQGSRLDIAADLDLDPASPALELGGEVRIRAPSLGVDDYLRVLQRTRTNVLAPGQQTEDLLLDLDPERITSAYTRTAPAPAYTRVADSSELASGAPPVVTGSIGAQVPSGQTAPGNTIPLDVEPLDGG